MSGPCFLARFLGDMGHAAKATLKSAGKAARGRIRLLKDVRIVRSSRFFDGDWYLRNNPDVAAAGMDPAVHYLKFGAKQGRNPSKDFVGDEYLALHPDVRHCGLNPLLHYETFGRREGRAVSLLEVGEPVFPDGAAAYERTYPVKPPKFRRTAVFASYSGSGRISDADIIYLESLAKVVDNVVFVADNPLFPGELERLDGLVCHASCGRHRQYDFGSYKVGYRWAEEHGLLDDGVMDELALVNDSCYAAVLPFEPIFAEMARRPVDFWGMSPCTFAGEDHIQSFFYVFRRKVVESRLVRDFLDGIVGPQERGHVIVRYEFRLTRDLESAGFVWDTYVPKGLFKGSPTRWPVTLMTRYGMPLLKVKVMNGDSFEDTRKALQFVRRHNPRLAAAIVARPIKAEHKLIGGAEHRASFPAKVAALAARAAAGERLKAVFFVTTPSMFPARPLFERMKECPLFKPQVVVIPDTRWLDTDPKPGMERCVKELRRLCGEGFVSMVEQDELGLWPDVLEDAAVVCYPSPYDVSAFRYNPHYSVGRDFLPVGVNYGFYRSTYDRHIVACENYAYLWKAFFECDETMEEYAKYSVLKGANAEKVGYVKMDALASAVPEPHARKRILVALHHSVDGGVNKELSLANFVRYADFFGALPDRYPEIDFVFRPHPFLFQIMSRPNLWGPERVEEYIAMLKAKSNVTWSDGGDYFREFAESDGCIQDCGSYLVEYIYTGKPCCYMLKSPGDIDAKFAPLGRKCLEQCYIAYSKDAMDAFIRDVVVGGSDPKAASRAAFAKTVMVNYPHAADAALKVITDALGRTDR